MSDSLFWSVYGGVHICQHAHIGACVCVCVVLAQAAISETTMATRHKNVNYSVSMSETYS